MYQASCHCGNITAKFETSITPEKMELRKCQCTFCTKHGAVTATDPNGRYTIRISREKDASRYRFGLRTAEFIICSLCGVYMAAVLEAEGKLFATINIHTLKNAEEFRSTPKSVNYEKETAMEKVSRRQEKWTPAVFEGI